MTFYSSAYRHVPINWIVGILNILSGFCGVFTWGGERIWSFLNAIWYNITGFDKYFIFMDNSPVPIPYWYYGGTPGDDAWLYDARNKVFYNCDSYKENKKENLPVLAMNLICKYRDETVMYDMSDWLEKVTFYTRDENFPHPLQLLSAWCLENRFWPATRESDITCLEVINAQTAETEFIPLTQSVCEHPWYNFDNEEYEEEAEEKASYEEDDEAVPEEEEETAPEEEEAVSEEDEEVVPEEETSADSTSTESQSEGSEAQSEVSYEHIESKPLPPSPETESETPVLTTRDLEAVD
jgi:hypothetical protein